jgi:hypothetical protein
VEAAAAGGGLYQISRPACLKAGGPARRDGTGRGGARATGRRGRCGDDGPPRTRSPAARRWSVSLWRRSRPLPPPRQQQAAIAEGRCVSLPGGTWLRLPRSTQRRRLGGRSTRRRGPSRTAAPYAAPGPPSSGTMKSSLTGNPRSPHERQRGSFSRHGGTCSCPGVLQEPNCRRMFALRQTKCNHMHRPCERPAASGKNRAARYAAQDAMEADGRHQVVSEALRQPRSAGA